jgi:DHA2 family multidrug resistance protein
MSLVRETDEPKPKTIDGIGLALIAIGLGSLQIMIDRGEDEDWFSSPFICVFAALAVVGILGAIAWLLYAKDPIVNIRVLKDSNLAISSVLMVAMASVLYASAVVLPQLAQQVLGYTATLAGLILSPGALLICFMIPMVNKMQSVVPTKYIICLGFVCMGAAMIYSHRLTPDVDFTTLALMRAFQAGGLAFIFAPLTTIAFATIDPADNGDATALFTMFRNVAGSIGISISTAMITTRTQIRLAHLQPHLTPLDPGYNTLLSDLKSALASHGPAAAGSSTSPTGLVYQMFRQQASILGYMDIFAYCAIMAFCAAPLCFLLKASKGGGGGHAAH